MPKTRIGVLGGGGITGAHAPGYRASSETAEVVAVAEVGQQQIVIVIALIAVGHRRGK